MSFIFALHVNKLDIFIFKLYGCAKGKNQLNKKTWMKKFAR